MKTRQVPAIFWVLVSLVVGILAGNFIPAGNVLPEILICFGLLAFLFALKNNHIALHIPYFITVNIFWILIGLYLSYTGNDQNSENFINRKIQLKAGKEYPVLLRVAENPVVTEKWIRCETEILQVNDTVCEGKLLLYLPRNGDSNVTAYGDIVYTNLRIQEISGPKNPDEFDYRNYLRHENIFFQSFAKNNNWKIIAHKPNPFFASVYEIRNYCSGALRHAGFSENNLSVAQALLLGDKTWVSDELMEGYAASGALHILAVSGLHVGIIMLILGVGFSPLKRFRHGKIIFSVCLISGIWFYAIITGLSPSVLRSAVMFSFVVAGQQMQRDTSIYQSLMISAMLLLLVNPNFLFKPGFLLSYSAVIGIVYFYPRIYRLLYFQNFALNKAWQVCAVSIAAQLGTLPLSLYFFGQFPNYFLLTNLWVIPLAFAILLTGITFFLTAGIPFLGDLISFLLNLELELLNAGVKFIEALPFAKSTSFDIRWYDCLALYGCIFLLSLSFEKKSRKILWWTAGFTTLFSLTLLTRTLSQKDQKQAVLYHLPNCFLVDFFDGSTYTQISSGKLPEEDQIKLHVAPHRTKMCGLCDDSKTRFLPEGMNLFRLKNITVAHLTDRVVLDDPLVFPVTDIVLLDAIEFVPGELVHFFRDQKVLVIASSNTPQKLRNWLKKSLDTGQFIDVSESGAVGTNF